MLRILFVLGWLGVAVLPENWLAAPGPDDESDIVARRWMAEPPATPNARAFLTPNGADPERYHLHLVTPATTSEAETATAAWRQELQGDWDGGDTVVALHGRVRTEEAAEAALWLVCYPAGEDAAPMAQYTTLEQFPVHGTQSWTEIGLTAPLPPETARIVVLAVLRGPGAAEFADISLLPVAVGEDSADQAMVMALFSSLTEELTQLRESNAAMTDLLQEIAAENASLRASLLDVQATLKDLESDATESLETAPPLTPHGVDWETLR